MTGTKESKATQVDVDEQVGVDMDKSTSMSVYPCVGMPRLVYVCVSAVV